MDEQIILSSVGKIVREEWFASANIRKEIHLDAADFIVMPNHIHGVVQIVGAQGLRPSNTHIPVNQGRHRPPLQRKPRSLSSFIAGFKSSVTKRAIAFDETIASSVWQRNFYEHIIRDEHEWAQIRTYIETNPANWSDDQENPEQ
jgi:putative transposase